MKIAVLGTGEVGRRLATKLVSLGHEVAMGSRTADNAEQLQHAFPEARVVKSLNTMTNTVMVEPGRVPGHHNVILDLGDLTSARAVEQLVQLGLWLYGMFGTGDFNFSVVTAPAPAPAG